MWLANPDETSEVLAGSTNRESNGMKYRVTFMERTNAGGVATERPPDYVEIDLPEGVVLDKTFVERTQPAAEHVEDALEEDDDFLSVGSETWDYDVADGRVDEFLAAVRNSEIAMECVPLDDEAPAS